MHVLPLHHAPVKHASVQHASAEKFITLRPSSLFGRRLQDVCQIEASIARFGLLRPLLVSTTASGRLVILDGRKRLAAIRRLRFKGDLPRSLTHIPYVRVKDTQGEVPMPRLLSDQSLYEMVMEQVRANTDLGDIADRLYLCRQLIKEIISISRLCPKVRAAFFKDVISFEQARAYAALPTHFEQHRVFSALGPFATESDILDMIRGDTRALIATGTSAPALGQDLAA